MTTAIGFSSDGYIEFIKEHAEEFSAMARNEMESAQDRTHLVRDIADFAANLESMKARGDWKGARQATWDFMTKHRETWAGGSMDLTEMYCNLKAWDEGHTIAANTYKQENFPGDTWQSSFHSDWQTGGPIDDAKGDAQAAMDTWIKKLGDWKDTVTGDDKIGVMKLQADADQARNLYDLGSNLISKEAQTMSLIISNIGKG